MARSKNIFQISPRNTRLFTYGDLFAIHLMVVIFYTGVRLAFDAPEVVPGPDFSISPAQLPLYTTLSVGR